MNMEKPGRRPVVAILGGGFAGAATAIHLARSVPEPDAEIVVVEPRPESGPAWPIPPRTRLTASTSRHRRCRSSPRSGALHGMAREGAGADVARHPDAVGQFFPERRVFGRYVKVQLAPHLAAGTISHLRTRASRWNGREDASRCSSRASARSPPTSWFWRCRTRRRRFPAALLPLRASRRLIVDPDDAPRIGAIDPGARVLILGTGLGAADVIASLDHRGFHGRITALSRHGLRSRGHAAVSPGVGPARRKSSRKGLWTSFATSAAWSRARPKRGAAGKE